MKKSDRFRFAMLCVLDASELNATHKLEIIETLLEEKRMAEYVEEREANEGAIK